MQWEGLGAEHATWEDHKSLNAAFPELNLEDKVALNWGRIVIKKI